MHKCLGATADIVATMGGGLARGARCAIRGKYEALLLLIKVDGSILAKGFHFSYGKEKGSANQKLHNAPADQSDGSVRLID